MSNWRNTRAYRVWRVKVVRRDKVCKCCGTRKFRHAHHIKHATYFKKLRFEVSNGITLCKYCHLALHTKIAGSYRKKCTFKHLKNLFFLRDYFNKNQRKL